MYSEVEKEGSDTLNCDIWDYIYNLNQTVEYVNVS